MLADGWCQTPFLDDDFIHFFYLWWTCADYRKPESLFPEIDKAEKPMFVFHPAKRHCNQAGVDVIRLSHTSGSPKGIPSLVHHFFVCVCVFFSLKKEGLSSNNKETLPTTGET